VNKRIEDIDASICAAGGLIGELLEDGPVNSKQAVTLIEAVVRAKVPNAERFEIRERAKLILVEIGKLVRGKANENHPDKM